MTVAAVAAGDDKLSPFLEPLIARGVEVRKIRVPHRAYLRERRRMADVCRELNPDVLHTHGYRSDLLARGPAKRQGIATVTTVHGFTGNGWKNRFYEALQVQTFKKFDAVVAVSEPLRKGLVEAGVPSGRAWMIRNAPVGLETPLTRTEARRVLGLPEDGPIVGWVGRLSPEKGPDVLLRAMTLIGVPQAHVSYLGDGPARVALEAQEREMVAQESLDSDRVRFHGTVPNAGRLLKAFDVLVLSSRTEGTPMVLFEAMDAEVPVVTTRVGGCRTSSLGRRRFWFHRRMLRRWPAVFDACSTTPPTPVNGRSEPDVDSGRISVRSVGWIGTRTSTGLYAKVGEA